MSLTHGQHEHKKHCLAMPGALPPGPCPTPATSTQTHRRGHVPTHGRRTWDGCAKAVNACAAKAVDKVREPSVLQYPFVQVVVAGLQCTRAVRGKQHGTHACRSAPPNGQHRGCNSEPGYGGRSGAALETSCVKGNLQAPVRPSGQRPPCTNGIPKTQPTTTTSAPQVWKGHCTLGLEPWLLPELKGAWCSITTFQGAVLLASAPCSHMGHVGTGFQCAGCIGKQHTAAGRRIG